MADEATVLHDELKSVVESALTPLRQQMDEERAKFGDVTGETKAAVDAVNTRLDELEVQWTKAAELRDTKPTEQKDEGKARKERFRAFLDILQKGVVPDEHKDMTVSVDSQGGFTVPEDFRAQMILDEVNFSPIRPEANVMQTSGNEIKLPKRTGRPTATWVGELGTKTESSPTVGQETIPTHELATYVDVSNWLLEDSAFDIESVLAGWLGEEFGRAEGAGFVVGTGVSQPEGLMTNTSVAETNSGSAATIADANGQFNGGITLMHALHPNYAANGKWVMNFQTLGVLRTLKDTSNQYIWQPGSIAGDYPGTILGRPYVVAQDMANQGANAYPILFGDLRRAYTIVDKVQLAMQRDPYTQNLGGLVRFVARKRVGGQVVLPDAVRKLKCSA